MNDVLKQCLEDLEGRIDAQEEEQLRQDWQNFLQGRFKGDIFSPRRSKPNPPGVAWPRVSINAALDDFDQMALQQFGECSSQLANATEAVLNVRCNYGSSIVPLLFGVEAYIMDEELDTLPTSRPLNDRSAVRRIINAGLPDLRTGFGGRVLEMGERFAAIAREYPNIGKYVDIYHPDLQGPMDICEVIVGSTIFYVVYDDPEMIHELLALTVQTYTAFLHAWEQIVPFHSGINAHWGMLFEGNIMLRDDSAMNFSRQMADEFIFPYDQQLLDEFGGGAIHFCGKGDHFIESLSHLRGLTAVNLSQPELNNMEVVFRNTVDKGIKLLVLRRDAAEEALSGGRELHSMVHCN